MATSGITVPHTPSSIIVLRWLARLASLASAGIILLFAFGESGAPSAREWLLLASFPVGMLAGMAIAWRREILGGAITLLSLAIFYALYFAMRGQLPGGPYFAILASPGALFLAAGLLTRRAC